jgi:hypothetical protein
VSESQYNLLDGCVCVYIYIYIYIYVYASVFQSVVLLGTSWGTLWEHREHREPHENFMRTHWEQENKINNPTPKPSLNPPPKRKGHGLASRVHAATTVRFFFFSFAFPQKEPIDWPITNIFGT